MCLHSGSAAARNDEGLIPADGMGAGSVEGPVCQLRWQATLVAPFLRQLTLIVASVVEDLLNTMEAGEDG